MHTYSFYNQRLQMSFYFVYHTNEPSVLNIRSPTYILMMSFSNIYIHGFQIQDRTPIAFTNGVDDLQLTGNRERVKDIIDALGLILQFVTDTDEAIQIIRDRMDQCAKIY